VLLLERGGFLPQEAGNWMPEVAFHQQRYKATERWLDGNGEEFRPGVHYFVGGNTKMFGAALERRRQANFEEVEHEGGVTPAWPIRYEDLVGDPIEDRLDPNRLRFGGWFDDILQRLLEAIISIPFLVLALIAIASAGPELSGNPILVVLVVALVYAPRIARMARAAAIDIATRDFVTVARLRGESAFSVMRRELLPNATSVLLVEFALRAGYAPVLIGSLGFLGFGLRHPTPEWGLMISEARPYIDQGPLYNQIAGTFTDPSDGTVYPPSGDTPRDASTYPPWGTEIPVLNCPSARGGGGGARGEGK
jgi:hypothetical protein